MIRPPPRAEQTGMRRVTAQGVVGVVLTSAALAGCGGDDQGTTGDAAPTSLEVEIMDFEFQPPKATVKTGGTITFVNRDKAPHTAETDSFDSGRLDRGQSKRIEFDEPGTYEYFCDFHRFMTATVEVTD